MPLKPLITPPKPPANAGKTPPSLVSKELPPVWSSPGVSQKPHDCKACPFRLQGSGFVPDWYPDDSRRPQIGFLLDFPSSDDVLEQKPWAGRAGFAWAQKYLKPFGLSIYDVFIGHVLRCQPKERKWGKPVYPTAKLRRDAELRCRQYDGQCWSGPKTREGGLLALDPNLFVVTFHPSDALPVPALGRLIYRDVEKAVKKMKEGFRPLILMGDESKDLVAPWMKGSVKFWRGNWYTGSWPFKEGSPDLEPGFLEI